jgi:hypothetical protein
MSAMKELLASHDVEVTEPDEFADWVIECSCGWGREFPDALLAVEAMRDHLDGLLEPPTEQAS